METLSVEAAARKIEAYFRHSTGLPFFVSADGVAECNKLKKIFKNLESLFISDFCRGDSPLDRDLLVEKLRDLDHDVMVFGLGEYVFFTAQENILRVLQDRNFDRKIVFVCRGVSDFLEQLADEDLRFRTNNVCRIDGQWECSVDKYSPEVNVETDAKNFSELLKLAESGKTFLTVKTDLPLVNVREVNDFYDAVKNQELDLTAQKAALTDEQWQEYFSDKACKNYPPEHWRSFAAGFKNKIADPYLRFVFARSPTYVEYRRNLFFAIFDVDEKFFGEFYIRRKAAVKNISAQYLTEYLERLEDFPDAVKYLTDNTAEERRAMIRAVQGKPAVPSVFKKNFPTMSDYLEDFDFGDAGITTYFRRYKKIKLCNIDDEDFKQLVRELALTRPYNHFETRQKILEEADSTAKLYWLDALGVEFLGYIRARATRLELFATIKIARAELPTLTSLNKNFYEEWAGDKFEKNSKLDDLKHSLEKFSADGKCSAPTYIDEELAIIDDVLAEIKISLANHRTEKIILTSDHGASRLAVMFGRENKFKMNSAGRHGGRCCPINLLDSKPNCATEENGWWVLANYDRFAGGRIDSVEVHGGALLEEVLVPVIEFSLHGIVFASEKIPALQKDGDDGRSSSRT